VKVIGAKIGWPQYVEWEKKMYSLYSKVKSWWVYLSVIIQHLKNERIYVITRPNLSFDKSWSMEKLKLPRWKITCNSRLFSIFWNMRSQWLTLRTCKDYLSFLSWQNIEKTLEWFQQARNGKLYTQCDLGLQHGMLLKAFALFCWIAMR
jgi:hypothetical protein